MRFLPFEKFTIHSKKSKLELISILHEQIEPKKHFRLSNFFSQKELKPYEGKIYENSFIINRIITYKNSFLPRIQGRFKNQYGSGSQITITMRIKILPFIFISLWSFAPILFFIFTKNKFSPFVILVCLLWFLAGFSLAYFSFNNERNKSKKFLINLFT